MCNRYHPARAEELAFYRDAFGINQPPRGHVGDPLFPRDIGPFGQGAFIRLARDTGQLEQVVGQWGLIGWFAKSAVPPRKPGRGGPILTNNARMETISEKPTFRDPWKRGQRCIIPAWSYVEPNWESGKNQWWRFRRADGQPWGMAGLWNTWTDKETGEVVESYTMVTLNADHHPLLNRMHRPDPTRPETMQDKRAVVPLAPSTFEVWLLGSIEEATAALRLPDIEVYDAGPDQPSLVAADKPSRHDPDQPSLLSAGGPSGGAVLICTAPRLRGSCLGRRIGTFALWEEGREHLHQRPIRMDALLEAAAVAAATLIAIGLFVARRTRRYRE